MEIAGHKAADIMFVPFTIDTYPENTAFLSPGPTAAMAQAVPGLAQD